MSPSPPPSRTGSPAPRRAWASASSAALLTLLVFLPSLRLGFVPWDDDMYLLATTGWRGPRPFAWAFSSAVGGVRQPLAWLSWSLDHALWGMDPLGYHLTSALLHAGAAALAFLLALELLGDELAALLAACFFALHPLRVESVAWVAERRDVLCGALMLGAMLAHARGRRAAVLALHALALLAKAQAAVLPALLLCLERRPRLKDKAALFALSAAGCLLAGTAQARLRWSWARHGLSSRLAQSLRGLSFYAAKTAWPGGLSPLYELRPPVAWTLAALAPLAVAALAWRERERRPWLLRGALFYAAALLPVLGLVQFGPQLWADRYSYAACLPLALAFGAAARRRPLVGAACLAALALACVRQQLVWRDGATLWTRVLSVDPASRTGALGLGSALGAEGRDGEALALFESVLAAPECRAAWAAPDPASALEDLPYCRKARLDRGVARARSGDRRGAAEDFGASVAADPSDPVSREFLSRLQPR